MVYILSLVLLLNSFAIVNGEGVEIPLSDLNGHWAGETVTKLVGTGIVKGYEDGTFKPGENVGVDAFIKITVLALGQNVEVGKEYWASTFIDKAKELDLVKDGEFDTYTRSINRGEIARIIVRALKLPDSNQLEQYKNKIADYDKIPDQYKSYILKAFEQKIINGYEDGSFQYAKNATRAEAAVMIVRMMDKNTAGLSNITELYVSAAGNDDTNKGTKEAPFKTIERARDAIRELKTAGAYPEKGITVYIREGIYEYTNSLELTKEDSGTDQGPVVYQAYPGEKVRLSGGASLKKEWFSLVQDEKMLNRLIDKTARKKIVQVDLKGHGITDYGELSRRGHDKNNMNKIAPMELVINTKPMTLVRWPNDEEVKMGEIIDPGPKYGSADFLNRGGTFSYGYDRPSQWKSTEDVWVSGVFNHSWVFSYNQVDKIDTSAMQVQLRYGEQGGLAKFWFPDFHHYENVFEEMDMPGEYYIDRKSGILYLIPPEQFKDSKVDMRVSILQTPLVRMKDSSNVIFKNIVIDTGRDTGVKLEGTNNIKFDHCEIRNFTNNGVYANGKNNGFSYCHIYNIGSTAVTLNGGNPETLEPANNYVENSHIHDFTYYSRVYKPGILLGYRSVGNRISNNVIHDGPHMAIIVYGNDHKIENNELYNVCTEFSDMGGIYANLGVFPQERGTVIRRNYFHDIGNHKEAVFAIYPDNGTFGWTIEENFFYNIGGPAVRPNGSSYMTVRNNIFVDVKTPYQYNHMFTNADWTNQWKPIFDKYDFSKMPHGTKYPELLKFFTEPQGVGGIAESNIFESNLIFNPTMALSHPDGIDDPHKDKLQAKDNWIATEDPGFVDWKKGNFDLKSDAKVFGKIKGFVSVPFSEVGTNGETGPN